MSTPSTPIQLNVGICKGRSGPDVVAALYYVVSKVKVIRDDPSPNCAPIQTVAEAIPHRVAHAAGCPVHNGDLEPAKDTVMHVHSIPVRDDGHVVGVGHLIAGKQALRDFQVLQIPAEPADSVQAPDEPRLWAFNHRQPQDLQTLNGYVAGLNQHTIRRSA